MVAHRLSRGLGVTPGDRAEDALVLGEAAAETLVGPGERLPRLGEGAVDGRGHAPERAVPGRRDQRAVEVDVGLVVEVLGGRVAARPLGARGHARERVRQRREVLRRRSLGGQAHGLHLEDAPAFEVLGEDRRALGGVEPRGQDVGVEDVPALLAVDRGSAAMLDRHQAALFEASDALACHPAADAELAGEVDFTREARAGGEPAAHDLGDQHPHEVLMKTRHAVIESPESSGRQRFSSVT
jgi:hypothetical protein